MTGSSPGWPSHAAAVFQPLVQPRPGHRGGGAVPGGVRDGGDRRVRPGRRVAELELVPVPGPPPAGGGGPGGQGRGREVHHPVAAQPPGDVHRQAVQQPGQPGKVIARVQDDDDVRVTRLPVPGRDQPGDDLAELGGGHLGGVIGRAEPDRVQRQRPGGAAGLQRDDPGVRPAGDHLRVALPPRVGVAEQPLRAGPRVRPQPVRHVAGQPDPAVIPPAQRDRVHRQPQPAEHDLAAVHRVVDPAVAAAALRLQAQLGQHENPPRPAGQRVRQVEQRIAAHAEGEVQLVPEPGQPPGRTSRPIGVSALVPGHNESHQPPPRCPQVLW